MSIKLAQPFPAPELRTKILQTRGFFWMLGGQAQGVRVLLKLEGGGPAREGQIGGRSGCRRMRAGKWLHSLLNRWTYQLCLFGERLRPSWAQGVWGSGGDVKIGTECCGALSWPLQIIRNARLFIVLCVRNFWRFCSQFWLSVCNSVWGPFNRNSRGNPSFCWLGRGGQGAQKLWTKLLWTNWRFLN